MHTAVSLCPAAHLQRVMEVQMTPEPFETDATDGIHRRTFLRLLGTVAAYGVGGGALTPLVASCSEKTPSTSGGSKSGGGSISVGVFQNPDSLDPSVTGLVTVSQVLFAVFDPLMWKFPGDDNYYPGLAERYTVTPDATRYTFFLKKGVKFHDGTPLTADAIKATFDHIADPVTKSRSAVGALGPYQGTRVVDAHTAEVTFSKPNAAFVNEMTAATLSISSPTALKKYGADYALHPVGTGPFIFKQFVSDQRVVVVRNPDYKWGPAPLGAGPATLKQITFRVLPDPSAQNNALTTGELQVAQSLNPADVTAAVKSGKKKLTSLSTGMPYCIMINAQKAPTDDLAVRQALQFGVNRKTIVDTLFKGLYQPASSVLTPGTPGYAASQDKYAFDKGKAEQLLDSAGWRRSGKNVRQRNGQKLQLEFINISGFGFDGISQLMQAQYRELGIDTRITDQAFPSVATTYNQGKQNLANWFYYDVDPYLLNTVFTCAQVKSGFNWEHYCNPSLDNQITAANGSADTAAREAKYQQIVQTLVDSATIIPIYDLQTTAVTDSRLSGIKFSTTAQPLFHSARF